MPENLPAVQQPNRLAELFSILDPATAQEIRQVAHDNQGTRGIAQTELDRIKVPTGGQLSLIAQGIDGEEHLREMSCLILSWEDRRAYYKTPYDQRGGKKNTPPDCVSLNMFTGVGNPGGKCSECPLQEWGSDPKGGAGKACKEMRQLLILRTGLDVPELFTVPATSLKNIRQYLGRLSARRISYWNIVTNVRLERVENTNGIAYSRIVFSAGPQLSPEQRATLSPFQKEMVATLNNTTVDTTDYEVIPDRTDDFTPPPWVDSKFAPPSDD